MADETSAPTRTSTIRRLRLRPATPATRLELVLVFAVALCLSAWLIGKHPRPPGSGDSAGGAQRMSGPLVFEERGGDASGTEAAGLRFTLEELAARRLPAWNPHVATGVPWLADPRHGVLDPQVWALSVLESIGGRDLSHQGRAWLAWLRASLAALGAYVLARRLGLRASAAATAAAGFAGSGACLAWIDASAGHVVPVLPWLLVALDRLREGTRLRSIGWVGLATALLVLGGQPEVAFCAGLAALVFALSTLEGRARSYAIAGLLLGTLASAPLVLPFLEYVRDSETFAVRRALHGANARFDFVALGLSAITVAIVLAWRGIEAQALRPLQNAAGICGVVLALCTAAFVLGDRGPSQAGRAFLLHDALGTVAGGGWSSSRAFAEAAIAWVPSAILALAITSFLARAGPLRERATLQALGAGALLVALGAPGVADLWRLVPFFGLGATAGAACVSALCLALLAGEALDAAPRGARQAAALAFVLLVSLALLARTPAPPAFAADPPEESLACTTRPAPVWTAGDASIAGFVADALPCDELVLRIERVDDALRVDPASERSMILELGPAGAGGRRTFHSGALALEQFTPGTWRFALDVRVRQADGRLERTGSRDVAWTRIARAPSMSPASMAFTLLAFLAVLFLAGSRSRFAWLACALTVANVALFARDLRPARPGQGPRAESETERVVRAEIGDGRFLAERGVRPGNAAGFAGLPILGGEDGLGLARFGAFRRQALKHGAVPGRDWSADEVDTQSAAFRLLGVTVMVLSRQGELPGFELVAGPAGSSTRHAEAFVYRARDPLPRAFTVSRLAARGFASNDPFSFDPRHEALLDPGASWRPSSPGSASSVRIVQSQSDRVALEVNVDGDALLVLADACYPGWKARVDGVETEILRVDDVFRGVPVARGTRRVEFDFEPLSLALGAWLGLAAFVALWILVALPSRAG